MIHSLHNIAELSSGIQSGSHHFLTKYNSGVCVLRAKLEEFNVSPGLKKCTPVMGGTEAALGTQMLKKTLLTSHPCLKMYYIKKKKQLGKK